MPFTFKVIPKNVKDYVFGNFMIGLTCYMNLKSTLEEAIKDATSMTKEIKQSLIPIGGYTVL